MPKKDVTAVRCLMTWDIRPAHETAFMDFIAKEFVPGLDKLGLRVTDFWSTLVGDGPQFLFGFAADDLETMQRTLAGTEWLTLQDKLTKHIVPVNKKIVPLTNRFQM